ncbi:MAG: hypothetical protein ACR2O4_01105 [Hyphomicrobiaceae bacterium]
MYKRIATAALVFGMAAAAPPVEAQTQTTCAPRNTIVEKLKKRHGETINGVGLVGATAAFEVWTSAKSGSWTILMTRPNKVSCIMASGDDWMEMKTLPEVGEPS